MVPRQPRQRAILDGSCRAMAEAGSCMLDAGRCQDLAPFATLGVELSVERKRNDGELATIEQSTSAMLLEKSLMAA